MNTIHVFKTPNVGSSVEEQIHGRDRQPISLLGYLQAENRKLQSTVLQLRLDILALRAALPNN